MKTTKNLLIQLQLKKLKLSTGIDYNKICS